MGYSKNHALLIGDYNDFILPLFNALFSCFITPKKDSDNNETDTQTKTHLAKPIAQIIDVIQLPPVVSGLITDLVAATAGATEERAATITKKNAAEFKKTVTTSVQYIPEVPFFFSAPLETQIELLKEINKVFTDINTKGIYANNLTALITEASDATVGIYKAQSQALRAGLPKLIQQMFACASRVMTVITHHFGNIHGVLREPALKQIAQMKSAQTKLLTHIDKMTSIEDIRRSYQTDLLNLANDYSTNWKLCLEKAKTPGNAASEPHSAGESSKDKGKQKRTKSTSFSKSTSETTELDGGASSSTPKKRTKKSISFSFGLRRAGEENENTTSESSDIASSSMASLSKAVAFFSKGRAKTDPQPLISAPTPIPERGGITELNLPTVKADDTPVSPPPAPKTRAPVKPLSRLAVANSPILSKKITDSPVLSGLSLSPRGSNDELPPLSLESTPAPAEDGSDSPGYIRIGRQRRGPN
jgi:hypothetical protein